MEPVAYWRALRKSWIVLLVLLLVGLAVGFGVARAIPNTYRATASLFVSTTPGATTTELQQGATFTQTQVQSYASLATTPSVLRPVITDLNLKTNPVDLAKSITATNPLNTVFVQISVTDSNAAQAALIANSVSVSLRDVVDQLAPQTNGKSLVHLSVVETAQAPETPASPNRHLIEGVGALLGLVAGIIFALVRARVDTRIRTEDDIEQITDTPILGRVTRQGSHSSVVLRDAATSTGAEDVRRIRSTLRFAGTSGPVRSLVVSSPSSHEHHAQFTLDLALASVERSEKVLVIEADLRTSGVTRATGLTTSHGLVELLAGGTTLSDAVESWHGVDVLLAGPVPSNPSLVLGSSAFTDVIEAAKAAYDFVVIDAPPLLPYADGLDIAHSTDGAVVLASARHTTREQLLSALSSLDGVRATTIGVVVVDSAGVPGSAVKARAVPHAAAQPEQAANVAPDPDTEHDASATKPGRIGRAPAADRR